LRGQAMTVTSSTMSKADRQSPQTSRSQAQKKQSRMVQKLKRGGGNMLRAAPESQLWAYGTPLA